MSIRIHETTIATRDVPGLTDFYAGILSENGQIEDHDFYFCVKDRATASVIAVVPHNEEKRWDQPWITFSTDDLPGAIAHLRSIGVREEEIRNFGSENEDGTPQTGVCFVDPEGRTVMLFAASAE